MKHRMPRVNELIHRELSDIFQRDLCNPRFGMVTVTEVRTSKDLRYAKVFYSVYGKKEQQEAATHFIESKASSMQRELGSRVSLRYTPTLQFLLDETGDKIDRLEKVFKTLSGIQKTE
ncbi:MAG: 30S ribosome-binding factor RbfA [Chlamydiae bacterium]|nr:30S ribosome-binding factor RbfA [Chlamydiota bacterium]MBI3265764.1 30S ribosome-binding factor RbfA [Chlamydiota bacterium]